MSSVIRTVEDPGSKFLPSQRKQGVVEELQWNLHQDGHHLELRRTWWTRNKRRAVVDQRGEIINQEVLLTLSPQEAARLMGDATYALIHVDGRGPREA